MEKKYFGCYWSQMYKLKLRGRALQNKASITNFKGAKQITPRLGYVHQYQKLVNKILC